jgi:hypothetical protein
MSATLPSCPTKTNFFSLKISRFLFPYITIHLKKKGWNWDDGEFSKNDQGFDIFDYIEPFWFDTDVRDRSFEDLEEYIRDNWYDIPLKEIKINKPNSNKRIGKDDIDEYGEYDEATNTFEVEIGSEEQCSYLDNFFEEWHGDEDITEEGMEQYMKDIKESAKEKYGKNVKVEFI